TSCLAARAPRPSWTLATRSRSWHRARAAEPWPHRSSRAGTYGPATSTPSTQADPEPDGAFVLAGLVGCGAAACRPDLRDRQGIAAHHGRAERRAGLFERRAGRRLPVPEQE